MMKKVFGILFAVVLLLSVQTAPANIVTMVLEQNATGEVSHRAADLSPIGDGIDPILHFILFNTPEDPATAQVLWEASETPVQWVRTNDEQSYRMVEHAVLPEGSKLEYRIFSQRFGHELEYLRHSRTPGNEEYGVDPSIINRLVDSEYNLQVHLIVPGRPTQVMSQRINVVEFSELIDIDNGQEAQPAFLTLEPGEGWSGDQDEPKPVGDPKHPGYPYRAIARWAVVPHQTFEGDFTIGVAAFHGYGIDRVEFSVDNGPWESVKEMAANPRTDIDEYFVNLNAGQFADGKVTVRAIAYPKHGKPRVLNDLELFANAGGSMEFPVLELGAGTHHLQSLSALTPKENGWLTIRPKPGVAKEDCVVVRVDRVSKGGHIKLQGLTFKAPAGNEAFYGSKAGDPGAWVWMDDVKIIGSGRENKTAWITHLWGRQYFTGCDISKVRSVFHGGGGAVFARNTYIHDVYEDVFRNHGYVAGVTVDGVKGEDDYHPDLFDFASGWTQSNVIYQDVTIREAYSQGMAGANMADVAMVNCDVHTPGWAALQIGGKLQNVVFQDSSFRGGALLRDAQPDGVIIRNSALGWRDPFLPENCNQRGVTVLEHPFDLK